MFLEEVSVGSDVRGVLGLAGRLAVEHAEVAVPACKTCQLHAQGSMSGWETYRGKRSSRTKPGEAMERT